MPAYTQSAGVRPELLTQLGADVKKITCTNIVVGDRLRTVDKAKLPELKESILNSGLDNPISVKYTDQGHYKLVTGAHRLQVWLELCEEEPQRWHEIPATVYPVDMSDEMAQYVEITENLDRNELTPTQRKTLAGKRALLRDKLFPVKKKKSTKESTSTTSTVLKGPPYEVLANALGLSHKGVRNWWKLFSADTGHDGTPPSKNPAKLTTEFKEWVAEAEKREEEEKAEKHAAGFKESVGAKLDDFAKKEPVLIIEAVELWLNDNR